MDARERLRRYLEQRRELGESELVLDGMSIEEVMRVLGAANLRAGAGAQRPSPPAAHEPPPEWGMVVPEALAAPDAAPVADLGAPADHPRLSASAPPTPSASAPPAAPAPERAPIEEPDELAPVDWREALRAAGAGAGDQPNAGMAPSTAPGAAAVPDATTGARAAARPAASAADSTGAGRAKQLLDALGVPVGLMVGEDRSQLVGGPFDHLDSIAAVADAVSGCTRCPLYKTATRPVPGEGNPDADLVVVGEAPGADEDASGRPFVGASGQLLTKILGAIGLGREDVFICNVIKHRPPGNRNPAPDEVEACSPYLVRQLELLRPRVILTLGNFAAQTLLATKLGITKLRGQVHLYYGIPLVPTYHPAALLRNEAWKRPTWEDVKLARRILDRAREG